MLTHLTWEPLPHLQKNQGRNPIPLFSLKRLSRPRGLRQVQE